MAGIGFALKSLTRQDNLLGVWGAFIHAALVVAGPWIFTVLGIALIALVTGGNNDLTTLNFRGIITYNFSFSLVLTAPITIVVTRFLADQIHLRDVTQAPAVLFYALKIIMMGLFLVGGLFYFLATSYQFSIQISAIVNLCLIGGIWLLGIYLLALKDYLSVSFSFATGMLVGVIAAFLLSNYGVLGVLNGFSIGLTWIFFCLLAKILAEYPSRLDEQTNWNTPTQIQPTQFKGYFKHHRCLMIFSFCYSAAIWVDKWIFWYFAPEAESLSAGLHYFGIYDNALFLAYLTLLPALALFVINVETDFFKNYQRFYEDILSHQSLRIIRSNQKKILSSLLRGLRHFLILQGVFSLLIITTAPALLDFLHLSFLQVGMFKLGTLGAFFHGLILFGLVLLSYFDCRRELVILSASFLISNIIFTFTSIFLGFNWYGYGYFFSCLLTSLLTMITLLNHVRHLPYHAFVTHNQAVEAV